MIFGNKSGIEIVRCKKVNGELVSTEYEVLQNYTAGENITITDDGIISSTAGSEGVSDYNALTSKPKINNVELSGDKTTSELGIKYEDLINAPDLPSYLFDYVKIHKLVSDSDYVHTDNNYTTTEKTKLANIEPEAEKNTVTSVNNLTGDVVITIPNKISDLTNDSGFINSIPDEYITESELNSKGYLTEHQDISGKVDKEKEKGLSTNDFTTEEKTKLSGIEAGAEVNKVISVNNQTGDVNIVVPSKVSDLTNDKGYITSYTETDPIYIADKPNLALKSEIPNNDDFSLLGLSEKSYNNLTDKPIIPSKTSDLTNDSNFVSDSNYVHTDNNYTTEEKTKLSNMLNLVYPVGSIYLSVNDANPETFLGGTWEQIKDMFLLASGDNYELGTTGGEATHKLTINEIPSHNHGIKYSMTGASGTARSIIGSSGDKTSSGVATNTGGGQAHNNMPPYLAVSMWQRTA